MILRVLAILVVVSLVHAADEKAKPVVAFFPLGGSASEELREKCGFSLRMKLDRTGLYEVVDGPKMQEVAAEAKEPIGFATAADAVIELGRLVEAQLLVWGEVGDGNTIRLKMLDLREEPHRVRQITRVIGQPTDLRFVSEQILETLPGVMKFEHPSQEGLTKDAAAEALWQKNPNLVRNWDFSSPGSWWGIYQAEYYQVKVSPTPAAEDKVVIWRMPENGATNNVLSMRLSRYCAENNGLACLSESIRIEPDTRYRLSFRYRSDGPTLHVFVKGYTMFDNIEGKKVEREIYRRQVPPSGDTGGKWVTVVDDLNPQHVVFPVQTLKIDLYAYLHPGEVLFDDIVLKAVGKPTRKATDEAIDKPLSRPRGAK